MLSTLGYSIYINLFEILMHGRIVYSLHLFIYSVLYVYRWNHGYLFHTLGYNIILSYVLVLIVPALGAGRSFS